jgi:hypothetical protein
MIRSMPPARAGTVVPPLGPVSGSFCCSSFGARHPLQEVIRDGLAVRAQE